MGGRAGGGRVGDRVWRGFQAKRRRFVLGEETVPKNVPQTARNSANSLFTTAARGKGGVGAWRWCHLGGFNSKKAVCFKRRLLIGDSIQGETGRFVWKTKRSPLLGGATSKASKYISYVFLFLVVTGIFVVV